MKFHEIQKENLRKMYWSLFTIILNNDERSAILCQKAWNKVYEFYGPRLCYDFLLHFVIFDVQNIPVPIYCYCTEKNPWHSIKNPACYRLNKYFYFRIIFKRNAAFTWPCPDWRTLREQWAHLDVRMDGHQEQSGPQSDREAVGVKPCHLPSAGGRVGRIPGEE